MTEPGNPVKMKEGLKYSGLVSLSLYSFRLSQGKDRLRKDEGFRCKFYILKYSLAHTHCLISIVSSWLKSSVLCLLSHFTCLTSPDSNSLSHISCFTFPVSSLTSPASSILFYVFCLMSCQLSCFTSPVSYLSSHIICAVSKLQILLVTI